MCADVSFAEKARLLFTATRHSVDYFVHWKGNNKTRIENRSSSNIKANVSVETNSNSKAFTEIGPNRFVDFEPDHDTANKKAYVTISALRNGKEETICRDHPLKPGGRLCVNGFGNIGFEILKMKSSIYNKTPKRMRVTTMYASRRVNVFEVSAGSALSLKFSGTAHLCIVLIGEDGTEDTACVDQPLRFGEHLVITGDGVQVVRWENKL